MKYFLKFSILNFSNKAYQYKKQRRNAPLKNFLLSFKNIFKIFEINSFILVKGNLNEFLSRSLTT